MPAGDTDSSRTHHCFAQFLNFDQLLFKILYFQKGVAFPGHWRHFPVIGRHFPVNPPAFPGHWPAFPGHWFLPFWPISPILVFSSNLVQNPLTPEGGGISRSLAAFPDHWPAFPDHWFSPFWSFSPISANDASGCKCGSQGHPMIDFCCSHLEKPMQWTTDIHTDWIFQSSGANCMEMVWTVHQNSWSEKWSPLFWIQNCVSAFVCFSLPHAMLQGGFRLSAFAFQKPPTQRNCGWNGNTGLNVPSSIRSWRNISRSCRSAHCHSAAWSWHRFIGFSECTWTKHSLKMTRSNVTDCS